jgi:hypothetical protein
MGVPLPHPTGLGADPAVRPSAAHADATLPPAPGGPYARLVAGGADRAVNSAVTLGARARYAVGHRAGTSQAGFTPDRSKSHPPGIGPTPKGRQ